MKSKTKGVFLSVPAEMVDRLDRLKEKKFPTLSRPALILFLAEKQLRLDEMEAQK